MNSNLLHSLRFKLVLLCNVGITCMMGATLSMAFAIVCMVDDSHGTNGTNISLSTCRPVHLLNGTTRYYGTFTWSNQMQSNMLIAHTYGALIALIPVGILLSSVRFKKTVTVGTFLMCSTTLLIPLAARQGFISIFILRFAFGLGLSIQYPFVLGVCSKWIPKHELGRMVALSYCGFQIGGVICNFSAGFICSTIGWQYIFYLWGTLLTLWLFAWVHVFDMPEQSKFLSETELCYIVKHRSSPDIDPITNIRHAFVLFKSVALWAGAIHAFTSSFILAFRNFYIPTYFKSALGIGPELNGILSGLPTASHAIGRLFCGLIQDKLLHRLSRSHEVKICCAVSFIIPAGSMCLLTMVTCGDHNMAASLMVILSFAIAFTTGSYIRAAQLMSPTYSALIIAFYDMSFNLVAILQSNMEGFMVENKQVAENWHMLFYVTATISICGGIFFIGFGSGEEQLSKVLVDDKDNVQ